MPGKTKPIKDQIFETELLPHIDALHTFAYHLAFNEEDAKDLVQETFLKSYRALDSYEPGTNAKAWLDRKSTRLNSSHVAISYAVFCLKKKNNDENDPELKEKVARSTE